MSDRLSNIWSRFSNHTSLNLSGTGVDNTPRPSRMEAEDTVVTFDSPVRVPDADAHGIDAVNSALTAMHTQMSASSSSRRSASDADLASFRALPETQLEKSLFADVSYTKSKTNRSGADYLTYAADRQITWQKSKKKWFFGLF